MNKKQEKVYRMVSIALLAALVVVFQLVVSGIKVGNFSFTLSMIPIIVGAVMFGAGAGAILGAVFSVVVAIMVITGMDAGGAVMFGLSPALTLALIMVKGTAAGAVAGLVGKWLSEKNLALGVVTAAVCAPVVNTGIFIAGMLIFYRDLLAEWAGGNANVVTFIFVGLIGVNFLIELGADLILSPVMVRILSAIGASVGKRNRPADADTLA